MKADVIEQDALFILFSVALHLRDSVGKMLVKHKNRDPSPYIEIITTQMNAGNGGFCTSITPGLGLGGVSQRYMGP